MQLLSPATADASRRCALLVASPLPRPPARPWQGACRTLGQAPKGWPLCNTRATADVARQYRAVLEILSGFPYRADLVGGPPAAVLHPLRRLYLLPAEEVEHPLDEESGGVRVVRRQRAVGEEVLLTGIEKQLSVLGLVN